MTTLVMPSSAEFAQAEFGIVSNSVLFSSKLTGFTQTAELPGVRWKAKYMLPDLEREDFVDWQVFFAQLRGQAGRFYAYDPLGAEPRGLGTGTPLIDGNDQVGTSLATVGWTASQSGILKKGDYFSYDTPYGRQMHMITEDINSNSDQEATLLFEPPIRQIPNDEAEITVVKATCEMMLLDDTIMWVEKYPYRYSLSFEAIEALGLSL